MINYATWTVINNRINNQILSSAPEINNHLYNVGKHLWFTTVRHLFGTLLNEVIMSKSATSWLREISSPG